MCLAFGASPGMHEALVNGMLLTADWVADHGKVQPDERTRAVRETTESVKAAILINGADNRSCKQLPVGDGSISGYTGESSESPLQLPSTT